MARTLWKTALSATAATLLAGCGNDTPSATDKSEAAQQSAPVKLETPPAGQLPTGVTPTAYKLDIVTDPAMDVFTGKVDISLQLDAPHARIWLHAQGPTVSTARATLPDGTVIEGTFTGDQAEGGVARIDFAEPVPAGEATLSLTYSAPYDKTLAGIYRADQSGKAYLASQMEPDDARRALPSFDEPRFKTPFTVSITAPKGDQVVTNGALVSETVLDNDLVKHTYETTRPLPTYLLAFAVGPYDKVIGDDIPANDVRAEPIPLRGYAAAGKGEKLEDVMASTAEMLEIQERYFNVPYPYEKLDLIAAPDYAFGAMENAGAIVYRESVLLVDERTSLTRMRGNLTTHAHELAHQWFGNLVTPKWWDDIWLNEAFATWFSYKTMHAYDPEGDFDRAPIRRALGAMGNDSLKSARQIRNPIERNGDIMDAFDGITYSKGGGVLAMFENYLGEDEFREGVRLHMQRFPDGIADVHDFMTSLADGSGDPGVVPAFTSFIMQPGIPYLDVTLSCEAVDAGLITIEQSRYARLGSELDPAQTWQIPLSLRMVGGNGDRTTRDLMSGKNMEIPLDGGCPDFVMPNAGGKGYWRFTTNAENWTALTENFNQLTAGEQLVFADSITAAFNAGSIPAETMLAGLAATTNGEWDAAKLGMEKLGGYLSMLPEEDRPALRTYIGDLYGPAWAFYGERSAAQLSQGERLLQESLYSAMINFAQDPEMRADLNERARQYVGLNGAPNESAVLPSELRTAMSVAAQAGGREFLDAALAKAYASRNQNERATIFSALASNLPAEDVAILLKEANGSEFTGQEMYTTFMSAMNNQRAREQNWTLFQQSWDNLVARTPAVRKARLARAAGSFCDTEKSTEAAEFFRANAADISGYERSLAQSFESSALCAALKEAKAGELAAVLKNEQSAATP